jgi:hypothetical protein
MAGQRETTRWTTMRNQCSFFDAVSILVLNSFHFKSAQLRFNPFGNADI